MLHLIIWLKTINGNKNIEDITILDKVLTRYGYQDVLDSWLTMYDEKVITYDIDGMQLTCTPNHKILINGKFDDINNLLKGDIIDIIDEKREKLWKILKLLSSMELDSSNHHLKIIINHIVDILNQELNDYIKKYGKNIMEILEKDTLYIIVILILITMIYRIYKWCHHNNMLEFTMQEIKKIQNLSENSLNILNELDHLVKHGIQVRKVSNGTRKMVKRYLKIYQMLKKYVNTVEPSMKPIYVIEIVQNIVQKIASVVLEENVELTTKHENVSYVNQNFKRINIVPQKHVHPHVVENIVRINEDYQDVYNLTINNHQEYYANGILVHNCVDALRCCALVIQLVVEKGLFRGGYGSVARPKKLTNTVFNRRSKTEPRRRRR